MKVLHVIPSVSAQSGGPSQAIFPMCKALRQQGVDVLLASTDAELETSDVLKLQDQYTDDGVPTILFPSQVGTSFKYSKPFASWLDEHVPEYDLVHIHAVFNHSSISAARSCQKHLVPYIVRPLGTLDPWGMKQKSLRKRFFWFAGIRRMLTQAAAIHYTSEPEQRAVEKSLGLDRGAVIHLGVQDRGVYETLSLSGNSAAAGVDPYVLFLSRLHPKKGLENLLQAFSTLAMESDFREWRLVVAGDGSPDYTAWLKRTATNSGAGDRVSFTGWLSGDDKQNFLRHASLLALPSYQENFGLCVMEALAEGVPVLISPHVNLAPQIEKAEAGWISSLERGALRSTLAAALSSKEERQKRGSAGRTLAKNFIWPIIAQQLTDLYLSVAGK